MSSNTSASGFWTTDFADRIQALLDNPSQTAAQFRRRAEERLAGLPPPVVQGQALAAKAILLSIALRWVGVDEEALIRTMFGETGISLTDLGGDGVRRSAAGSRGQPGLGAARTATNGSARACTLRKAESPARRQRAAGPGDASAVLTSDWSRAGARLRLSHRELEIVMALFDGRSEKQVAADLRISVRTVHTHIERIYQKTQAQNRAQLLVQVFWALVRDSGVTVCDFCSPNTGTPR